MGTTWAILNMSVNIPSSNILLNIRDKGNASGVAISAIKRPGKPQCDVFDFFMSLHSFATSMGDVLILVRFVNISSLVLVVVHPVLLVVAHPVLYLTTNYSRLLNMLTYIIVESVFSYS